MTHEEEGYIIEFITVGSSVKVTAFDPATLTEVSMVGSPKAGKEELARLAVQKLQYVLQKQSS